MNIYEKMSKDISKLNFDSHRKKIYKPILLLAYINYLEDTNTDFNKLVNISLLIDYISIFMEEEKLQRHLFNTKNNDLKNDIMYLYNNDFNKYEKKILNKFREMPLAKIVTDSEENHFFQNEFGYKKILSRKIGDQPWSLKIQINEEFDKKLMIKCIKESCDLLIRNIINIDIDINLTETFKKAQQDFNDKKIKYLYDTKNDSQTYSDNGSRIGQQTYRKRLLTKYNNTCALCSINIESLLTASHAKPWVKCDNLHECTSPNNGLLLCKNHDALFDRGLITIDWDNKCILFSSELDSTYIENKISGSYDKLKINLDQRSKKYIVYHNNYIFKH